MDIAYRDKKLSGVFIAFRAIGQRADLGLTGGYVYAALYGILLRSNQPEWTRWVNSVEKNS
jgi:hypothetical protein